VRFVGEAVAIVVMPCSLALLAVDAEKNKLCKRRDSANPQADR
jgi:hypothetical protein